MKIKLHFTIFLIVCFNTLNAQQAKNIFIITTDGFRWQEIFNGADSNLLSDTRFVKDTALAKNMFWHSNLEERRKKLLPFFWSTIVKQGQLYGNRDSNSFVKVKNLFKISYPGYNELFTGHADLIPVFNKPKSNKNTNIFEYLDGKEDYTGKVVAFSSWSIFPYILNKNRNNLMVNSGYENLSSHFGDISDLFNETQNNIKNKTGTRQDMLTYIAAKNYIENNHPRVVLIGFGETDEYAHKSRYDLYLQHAANLDQILAGLWYMVQTDPFYKDETIFLITTDHGRGNKQSNWNTHNTFIAGSGNIWMGLLGKSISPYGEMKNHPTIYQNQIAATILHLLGEDFESGNLMGKYLSTQ